MQVLKRLFGDVVYEMFPLEFMEAVDDAYKFWREHPDSYLVMPYDETTNISDVVALMRAYAEIAGTDGYTIRTLKDAPDGELHWRAQTRISHKKTT